MYYIHVLAYVYSTCASTCVYYTCLELKSKNWDKLFFIGWLQGQNIGLFQRDSISDREQQDNHSYIGAANNSCTTMGDCLTELAKYPPINHQVQSNCSQLYRDFAEYPQLSSSWALLSIQGARDPREAVLVFGCTEAEIIRTSCFTSTWW